MVFAGLVDLDVDEWELGVAIVVDNHPRRIVELAGKVGPLNFYHLCDQDGRETLTMQVMELLLGSQQAQLPRRSAEASCLRKTSTARQVKCKKWCEMRSA